MIFWDGKGDRSRYQERELELLTPFLHWDGPFSNRAFSYEFERKLGKCFMEPTGSLRSVLTSAEVNPNKAVARFKSGLKRANNRAFSYEFERKLGKCFMQPTGSLRSVLTSAEVNPNEAVLVSWVCSHYAALFEPIQRLRP